LTASGRIGRSSRSGTWAGQGGADLKLFKMLLALITCLDEMKGELRRVERIWPKPWL
jgi:hypothetical protein